MSKFSKGDKVHRTTTKRNGKVVKVMEDDDGKKKYRVKWSNGDKGVRRATELNSGHRS